MHCSKMPMCWRHPTCQRKDHFVKLAESLQKLTDQYVAEVDQVLATKEKELSEI